MKKQYEKPAVNRRQIKLENTIAGSTTVTPDVSDDSLTVEDWKVSPSGDGDNWAPKAEWKW